jgi:hypothetical protein
MTPTTFATKQIIFTFAIVLAGICLALDGAPAAFRWQK